MWRPDGKRPPSNELLVQDLDNMVTLQRGMKSCGLKGQIVYSEQERRIQHFLAEVDLYLTDRKFDVSDHPADY